MKWVKPVRGDFAIRYGRDDAEYNPDFVVETTSAKFIWEPKAVDDMTDETVQAKAKAAAIWCVHATAHANTHGGKPLCYLLIPETAIHEDMTLSGLASAHTVHA